MKVEIETTFFNICFVIVKFYFYILFISSAPKPAVRILRVRKNEELKKCEISSDFLKSA